MRLTIKLVSMLFIVVLIIIAIDGYLSMVREVGLFQSNMRSNASLFRNISEGMITEVWLTEGRERALELINDINEAEHKFHLYFIDKRNLESLLEYFGGDESQLDGLQKGNKLSIKARDKNGEESLFTFMPMLTERGAFPGVLVLAESYGDLKAYTRETLIRTIILSVVLVLVGTAMLWILGKRYVGKPLQSLMARTQKIGAGDFSSEPVLPGHNELTHLSELLNQMCVSLETARNRLKEETEKKVAAIEQLRHTERLATVGRLASGVAHELGTPLNVISGRAKLMAYETENTEEVGKSCRIISEQAERMTKIIKQLLDFARRRRSQRSFIDTRPLLREIAEILNPIARKSGVNIELDFPDDMPEAYLDQSQIQQVLINIIVNGIQSMPEGGKLHIKTYDAGKIKPANEPHIEGDFVCVEIQDQGEGIPAEIIDKIFDPFFTTKEVGSGTGLGLSITHGIIREHNGWIDVKSEIGQGTVFKVFLPVGEENEK